MSRNRMRTPLAAHAVKLLAVACAMLSVSCSEEAPPPPPPQRSAPPPPPPPPAPEPVDLQALREEMGIDPRLVFAQAQSPLDESLARAVLTFGHALLTGDSDAFAGLLSSEHESDLDRLIVDDGWFRGTEGLEQVTVLNLEPDPVGEEDADAAALLIALQDVQGSYVLGWELADSGGWKATAVPVTTESRASNDAWEGLTLAAAVAEREAADAPDAKQGYPQLDAIIAYLFAESLEASGVDLSGVRAAVEVAMPAMAGILNAEAAEPTDADRVAMWAALQAQANLGGQDLEELLEETTPGAGSGSTEAEDFAEESLDLLNEIVEDGEDLAGDGTAPNFSLLEELVRDAFDAGRKLNGTVPSYSREELVAEIAKLLQMSVEDLEAQLGGGSGGGGGGEAPASSSPDDDEGPRAPRSPSELTRPIREQPEGE